MAKKRANSTRKTGKGASGKRKGGSRTRRRSPKRAAAKTSKAARSRNAARAAASRSTRKKPAAAKKPSTAASAKAAVKGAMAGAVAAVTNRLPGASIDGLALLEADHRQLQDLLARGEKTTERAVKERTTLLDSIAAQLTVHETIEERVLYPALKKYPEARAIVLEGFQEHHVADLIMKELYDTAASDEQWGAKFKVFKENIDHHIQEEEGPMFRTARGVMSREELLELGRALADMKRRAEAGQL